MILNEGTFVKLDKVTRFDPNKVYEFIGTPTLGKLTRLEKEITQDIVSIATGGLVYVRDQNERNRKGLCEVIPEVDSTGISRGKLGSFALNCKSRKFDPEQYFTFGLADIMAREKYLLIKKHPNGDKWVPDNARYNAIQKLLDRMVELAAERDAATREYRDTQGYDRPRNVRQTIEQRFEQEITADVTYLGANELHHALVWLATHVLTISANLNSKLLPFFKKHFGDVKQSVTVVDSSKRTKNGAPAKYSWSFQASIKDPETVPYCLKKYLNEKGNAITDTGFVSKLVREYGFNFGKNNPNQTLKNLADILNDPDIASLVKTNEGLEEGIDKMVTKITKSELKQMIREALREELAVDSKYDLTEWVSASGTGPYFLALNYWITGAIGPVGNATTDKAKAIDMFNLAVGDAQTRARAGKITKVELVQFDSLSDTELNCVNSHAKIENALKSLKYTVLDSMPFKTAKPRSSK